MNGLNTTDRTAEARRFAASGLDVNELVRITIDNTAGAARSEEAVYGGGGASSSFDRSKRVGRGRKSNRTPRLDKVVFREYF